MNVRMKLAEGLNFVSRMRAVLDGHVPLGRASMTVSHKRPYDFDEKRGVWMLKEVDEAETVWNLITNAGRIYMHTQCYGTSGLGANGLNYIALSNDTLTETATSTTLSNEIASNGLTRAQGTVTLPTGSGNQTTVDKTFTATGTQSCQKMAVFTASSAGTMQHCLAFTARSLVINDTIQLTLTSTMA